MSDKEPSANVIPAESLSDESAIKSWTIPTVATPKTKKIFTAKREDQQRKRAAGETIEDYKGAVKPKPMTAQDLQQMVQDAQKEGFDKGYQEGLQKGLTDGEAKGQKAGHDKAYKETKLKLESETQSFHQIASHLLVPMQEQEQALEKIIVDMAVNFAQKLLHREIDSVPSSMLGVIEHALQSLPAGAKNITVYVNPEDANIIASVIPEHLRQWQVKEDAAISRCGCRVETLESIVDYTVEARLEQFLHHIREQLVPDLTQVPPVKDYKEEIDPELASFQAMKAAVSDIDSDDDESIGDIDEENIDALEKPGDVEAGKEKSLEDKNKKDNSAEKSEDGDETP